MKKVFLPALTILAIGLLILTGCQDSGSSGQEAPPPEQASGGLSGEVVDGVRVIELTAEQFKFVPETIRVKKGEKVRINATSADVPHGIGLNSFGINERIEPGKETVIEFTPNETGIFQFHCTVYCGSGHGDMNGTFVVEE